LHVNIFKCTVTIYRHTTCRSLCSKLTYRRRAPYCRSNQTVRCVSACLQSCFRVTSRYAGATHK